MRNITINGREIEVLTVTDDGDGTNVVLKSLTVAECLEIFGDPKNLKRLTYQDGNTTRTYSNMAYSGLSVDAVGIITVYITPDAGVEQLVAEATAPLAESIDTASNDITDLQLVAASLYEDNLTLADELAAAEEALAKKDIEITDLQLAITEIFEAVTAALDDTVPEVPVGPGPETIDTTEEV